VSLNIVVVQLNYSVLHILTGNNLSLVALFLLLVLPIHLRVLVLLDTLSFLNIQFCHITFVVFLSALVAIINGSGV